MSVTSRASEPIGPLLRRIREERGLTQGQVSIAARVGRSMLSKIESGERRPSYQAVERLAKVLRTPKETFLAASGYDVAASASLPEPPTVDEALHLLHAAWDREKQRPVAVRDRDGAIVDLLPQTPALAAVLDRLELGAEMIAGATRDLRHLLTISERKRPERTFLHVDEENYLAPAVRHSATVAGQLAVDLAAVLPPDLAADYAHEMANLDADERLAALNALIAYVRDEERRRGGRRSARCADAAEPGGTPSQAVGSDASD